jgi:PIN domain nuclease of toxin-antitoxin system
MNILLDTQIVLWLQLEQDRLTSAEEQLLTSAETFIHVSVVSFWEMRLKWTSVYRSGQRKLKVDPQVSLTMARAAGWRILVLDPRHAVVPLSQPLPHRDPFDEILLVQAQEEGMRLLTRDERLRPHPHAFQL